VHVFVLIDLMSQIKCIPRSVRTPQETFLIWLAHHGEVSKVEFSNRASASYPPTYRFRSWWGLEAAFTFDADSRLLLIGDHATWEAWPHYDAE
jgi:hypothetical protein